MPEYDPPVPPPPLPPPVSVAARFVSETTLEAAKQAREEAWKETYAKLGQEPPPKEEEAPYDGRSLWEKLQEHKDKKQEAFDEQIKFKNQFRALDEDEISFLDSLVDEDHEEEDRKKQQIKDELASFRKAVVSRGALPPPPDLAGSPLASISGATPAPAPAPAPKKAAGKKKKGIPGVIVKKKAPAPVVIAKEEGGVKRSASGEVESEEREGEEVKKRKVDGGGT